MDKQVLGFCFTPNRKRVLLIKKTQPEYDRPVGLITSVVAQEV